MAKVERILTFFTTSQSEPCIGPEIMGTQVCEMGVALWVQRSRVMLILGRTLILESKSFVLNVIRKVEKFVSTIIKEGTSR